MQRVILTIMALCMVLSGTAVVADEPYLMRFWLPDNDWALEMDLNGFVVQKQEISPDLKGRSLSAVDTKDQVLITVFLEPATQELTSSQYRDSSLKALKEMPVDREDLKTYEIGDVAFTEYIFTGFEDIDGFYQPNAYAYLVKDSTWIYVHISFVDSQPGDDEMLDRLLGSLKIIEGYQATSFDYYIFGSWCYLHEDLESAIHFYERGLALEKQDRVLPRDYWLVMVDNLGMSYGMSGDGESARRILEYGLSHEPEYPNFHYNMACYYAEKRELDSALESLAKAYEYKANMIPGEELPDPYEDSSFRRYWRNKRFKKLISNASK